MALHRHGRNWAAATAGGGGAHLPRSRFPIPLVNYSYADSWNHPQKIIDGHLIIDLPDYFLTEEDEHLMETTFDKFPFYQEHYDEIDWCRPRNSWNMNQDYTYFNLFGCIVREDFTIHQLLASPEEFAKEDLFPHVPEEFDYSKCDKICVVCGKDEHKERIASLKCGHGYHVYCMQDWLHNWNICLLYKFDALT
ncbi:hypothetical protein F511_22352 [Dorcoceras hygrometricum]|uniref:RING-type domain-containing protein n=1 Tax=Dorcoceras hygrometricum TaxID=472368 RepID=A0A2Z7D9T5_9LAMI|nr:hypothetical protein F511_22352 [Dorcoceras hygrometricum]